jgi:hypothetical protein
MVEKPTQPRIPGSTHPPLQPALKVIKVDITPRGLGLFSTRMPKPGDRNEDGKPDWDPFAFEFDLQSSAWPKDKPFQLSKCLQWLLAPYFKARGEFRGLDLNEIKLYEGLPEKITQFAVIDVAAITIWTSIYFAPNQYSGDLDGIELVAHELIHVRQWLLNGQIGFPAQYGAEFAKNLRKGMSKKDAEKNISFELEATREAANIKEAIKNQYGEDPCSKYKP